jgi:beta-exotoxin I transport system permease protein
MTTAVGTRAEIARQMLRGGRRALFAWAAAFAALVALYAVIWPSIRGNNSWQELFNTLPKTYRAIFTAGGQLDLSTPAGYLGIELMGFLGPALMAVYAISTGTAAIAGEEGRGGLEVTLSAPVTRGRVLGERAAALLIELTAVAAATGLTMWVFSLALGMHLGVAAIASAAAALGIFGFFSGAVALAVGAATGSAALARGLAALVAVASYLINALAQVTSTLKPARPLSPFYLLFGNEPLQHGLRPAGALSVLAVSLALVVAGGIVFARRDMT